MGEEVLLKTESPGERLAALVAGVRNILLRVVDILEVVLELRPLVEGLVALVTDEPLLSGVGQGMAFEMGSPQERFVAVAADVLLFARVDQGVFVAIGLAQKPLGAYLALEAFVDQFLAIHLGVGLRRLLLFFTGANRASESRGFQGMGFHVHFGDLLFVWMSQEVVSRLMGKSLIVRFTDLFFFSRTRRRTTGRHRINFVIALFR